MGYCAGKIKATVDYQFPGKLAEKFVFDQPPIDVVVVPSDETFRASAEFGFNFDGNVAPVTYAFTCLAPAEVPDISKVYLISGTWDDWGIIGNYSTGYGIVKSYAGEPLEIGEGRVIFGSVFNEAPIACYANIKLEWRWGEGYLIQIFKDGIKIFEDGGKKYPKYRVACDDECPPGHIRCPTNSYPGYCCLPCQQIAQRINNMVVRK